MFKDRDYQINAVDAAIKELQSGVSSTLISAATGTGKSIIIARLIKRLMEKAPHIRVIVATHVAELLMQNSNKLRSIWPDADIGIFSAGLGMKNISQITFGGIQSIYAQDFPKTNLLIVDEAHTISRKSQSMWQTLISGLIDKNPNLKIVGLTATDFRLDSGSMTSGDDAMFDTICFSYGLGRAIQDGYLCELRAKHTDTYFDVSGVGKIAGEFNQKDLEEATNRYDLNSQAVTETIERGKGRKSWLVFCNGVKHSFAIRDELRSRGISCETVTGETPDNERERILEDFKSGKLRAVTNNAVWTTGIDVPNVDMIVMLRHTLSGGLLLQMAGRGTRTIIDLSPYETATARKAAIAASEKPYCLFLDFAGNIERHGFLDQIKGKDKKEKGDGVAPMKFCPSCASILHAAATYCKDCGHEFPRNEEEILHKAYDGAVISAPVEKVVDEVIYSPHNLKKEGKTPCLMVKYVCQDGSVVKEYICLQHGGFAGSKAKKWWNARGGGYIEGADIEFITTHKMYEALKIPKLISVEKDGKFDRITSYKDFYMPEARHDNTIDEILDVSI